MLFTRSVCTSKGRDMNPVALELQAIAVSLDPHVTPQGAPAPTRCGFGPGVYGSDLHHRYSLFYLSPDLFERTNSEFVNFLNQVTTSLDEFYCVRSFTVAIVTILLSKLRPKE